MNIKIGGKDFDLHFGLDFISALDSKYYVRESGFKLGQGMTYAVAQIEMGNPTILVDLVQAATITEKNRPKIEDIKKYIEKENIEELMDNFLSSFEKTPTTKFMMRKLKGLTNPKK